MTTPIGTEYLEELGSREVTASPPDRTAAIGGTCFGDAAAELAPGSRRRHTEDSLAHGADSLAHQVAVTARFGLARLQRAHQHLTEESFGPPPTGPPTGGWV